MRTGDPPWPGFAVRDLRPDVSPLCGSRDRLRIDNSTADGPPSYLFDASYVEGPTSPLVMSNEVSRVGGGKSEIGGGGYVAVRAGIYS